MNCPTCPQTADRAVAALGHKPASGGTASSETYAVFQGITLSYNRFNTAGGALPGECGNLVIDHCLEGRVEYASGGALLFLGTGDLLITKPAERREAFFPQQYYRGVSVCIDTDAAPKCLSCLLDDVEVSPAHLAEKFCGGGRTYAARSDASIEHIFSELYAVPDAIRMGYCKVKILELLLFLSALDIRKNEAETHILAPAQLALARKVSAYLTARMDERITLDMLARIFHVSGTGIKSSFKAVYGESLYAHVRTQKMRAAAKRLTETDLSVLTVAGEFGYDNASKFAKAFRDVFGVTPAEYRRRHSAGSV